MSSIQSGIRSAALVLALSLSAAAQQASPPAAPIPSQIHDGKKVFISYAGGEEFNLQSLPRGLRSDQAYKRFYTMIKAGGRFEPVLAPSDADLVFDFHFRINTGRAWPQLILAIVDPKTHVLLWTFSATVKDASGPHRDDKVEQNFNAAISVLLNNLTTLAAQTTSASAGK